MSFHDVGKGQASAYFKKINAQVDKVVHDTENGRGSQSAYVSKRIPWIMSTTEWLEEGHGIVWWCNPSDISWNMRLRQATSKNANSTVTHNWPNNNRGTYFDEFVLNLTLQTGNLMPFDRSNPYSTDKPMISPGLVNFYDFLKLMDAPKLTRNGRTNHIVIKYNSNIFPSLTLIGQFEPEGLKFNDTSSDPHNVNSWNVSFIVYDSSPRLSDNIRTPGGQSPFAKSDLLDKALNSIVHRSPFANSESQVILKGDEIVKFDD